MDCRHSDDFHQFCRHQTGWLLDGDGGAINATLGAGPVDTISWGLSLTRLMIGREQSIGSARSRTSTSQSPRPRS